MIPSTLTGLLVFLAAVGPGYLYVQVVEHWRPARDRTTVREVAEIVVSGALATTVGVVVALIATRYEDLLDAPALVRDPGQYLASHPARTGLALAVVLAASYGLAYLVARYSPGKGARVYADSAWYGAFERDLPEQSGIVASVELRDGRVIGGVVRSFTAEQSPVDERELTLAAPVGGQMRVRTPDGRVADLLDAFIILRGSEIVYVSGSYKSLM